MRRVSVGATSVLIVVLGLAVASGPALADPSTFSPSSNPLGVKFKEWSARWQQFVRSFPSEENPLLDTTGERCAIGQSGPVWFLMGSRGTTVTREKCSIPEGTALLFPVLNVVNVDTGTNQTAEELRAEAAPFMDGARNLSVSVDGEPLKKLEKAPDHFRIRSTVFSVTLPADNLFGVNAGTYSPAIDDGFYVMLKPLGVGPHTLHFSGQIPAIGFSVDVTYVLEVVATRLE